MKLRKFAKYSILGWFNRILFQWFFFRLQAQVENDLTIIGWDIIFPILPLTGWGWKGKWMGYIPQKYWTFNLWRKSVGEPQ